MRYNKFHGLKFRRQHPIGRFIVDFYCHKLELVIKLDGEIHLDKEVQENDKMREDELQELGLTVIRFRNEKVLQEMQIVLEELFSIVLIQYKNH